MSLPHQKNLDPPDGPRHLLLPHAAAYRVERIALLTSGVSHDLCNLMTAIVCNTEVLVSEEQPFEKEILAETRDLARRGVRLLRWLLNAGTRSPAHKQVFDPAALLQDLQLVLNRMVAKKGTLHLYAPQGQTRVDIDPVELEQVLINLVGNARDAIGPGGEIRLTLSTLEVPSVRGLAPRRYAVLVVEDDGMGIHPHHLPRLFDPFFSTKPLDEGTGLGLAICKEYVERNGGSIHVESQPGRGSSFWVVLPEASVPFV